MSIATAPSQLLPDHPFVFRLAELKERVHGALRQHLRVTERHECEVIVVLVGEEADVLHHGRYAVQPLILPISVNCDV